MSEITCPSCKSDDWRCWDERTEYYLDHETQDLFEHPVGYLHCNQCGERYTHIESFPDATYIGDDFDLARFELNKDRE